MILITGCTGLIGYHFTELLVKAEQVVKLLIRSEDDKKFFKSLPNQNNIHFHIGDVLKIDSLQEALVDVDYVVHAAAIVSFNKKDVKKMFKTNIEGTANVVNCCLDSGKVKRLFQLSSIAAFGRHETNISINEDTKWKESEWNSDYGKSKYLSELEVWRGVEEGLDATILNPSIVLGKNLSWKRSSAGIIPLLFKNSKYYLEGGFNFIDLRDLGDIFLFLFNNLDDSKNQRFLINHSSISNKDLFTKFNAITKRENRLVKLSNGLLNAFLGLQWLKTTFLGGKTLITKDSLKALQFNANYDNQKTTKLCKVDYRTIDNTLQWLTNLFVDKI